MKKIGNSFKGIFGGFILIIIGICILWWNEGNNVKNLKTTAEMDDICIDVKSDKINSDNEGKLIATHGKLINEQELTDETFNIKIKTPLMKRTVEVYQWEENSSTDDDGNTTYSYKKVWSDTIIDSTDFHKSGHDNPKQKLYENEEYASNDVKVGTFSLTSKQIKRLSTDETYTDFNEEDVSKLNLTISNKYLTNSEDLDNPKIGDTRISFTYNNTTDLSVLAVQTDNTFTDFTSKAGKKVNRIMDGVHNCKDMINVIKDENNFLKWLLRGLGALLCMLGFGAILGPISALTSFIPIIGNLIDTAVGLVAFILGLCVALIVIALAWIRFRPIIAITALILVAALIAFLIIKGKKKSDK